MTQLPLLSLLIATPLAGALLVAMTGRGRLARVLHAATLAVTMLLALAVVAAFDPADPGFQLLERRDWIPSLNSHWRLGVDGIAVLFPPLTVLLFAGVLVSEWNVRRAHDRVFHALLLALLGVTLGIFCALDTLLFFVFWELSLLPLYFLIGLWGAGPARQQAAAQYVLIMLASGAFLLFGLLFAAAPQTAGAAWNFDLQHLLAHPPSLPRQWPIFVLLLLGFAAKAPLLPLHTWLPNTAMQGPPTIVALLLGLKLGAYGLIRIAVPLAPQVARELHWLLAGLGTLGILYGAVAALTQTNLRRMLAYASISHVGLVLLGIAAFDAGALAGALLLLLGFPLTAGGLALVAAFLHRRTGTTDALELGGIHADAPRLSATYLVCGLASIGVPGLCAFPGELAIIVTALATHTGAGLAALFGGVVGAAAMLGTYRRAFQGRSTQPGSVADLLPRERAWIALVLALILAAGLAPDRVFDAVRASCEAWVARAAPG